MEVRQQQGTAPADLALETWGTDVLVDPGRTTAHATLSPPRSPSPRLGLYPRLAEPSGAQKRLAVGGSQRRCDALWRAAFVGRARWDAEAVRDDLRAYPVATWGSRRGSWSLMKQGFSKKASIRQAWRGNIVERQVELRTAKLGCFWPMPVGRAMPCLIVPSIRRKPGRTTVSAVSALGCPRSIPLPRSPSWRARCSSAPSTRGCQPPG